MPRLEAELYKRPIVEELGAEETVRNPADLLCGDRQSPQSLQDIIARKEQHFPYGPSHAHHAAQDMEKHLSHMQDSPERQSSGCLPFSLRVRNTSSDRSR